MHRQLFQALSIATMSGVLALAGCSRQGPSQAGDGKATSAQAAKPMAPATGDEHGHKQSNHGGLIVSIGADSYHAEAVFEKGGMLRLFMLGKDESRILEVEAQPLQAYAKLAGATQAQPFTLKPEPQPGDKQGMTSQFVGTLPRELAGKVLEVTIPNLRIAEERFRVHIPALTAHTDDMPKSELSMETEKQLYLTPGGLYTQADIQANGNQVASVKFKNFRPKHDLRPKPGEKICPITLTKANAGCTWVVAGKTYEFCCPPCVEEFVKLAKENPGEIKQPGDYVKK